MATKWGKLGGLDPRAFARKNFKDHNKMLPMPFQGTGEGRAPKVMSNEDRRRLGVEQDESLPDYKPDENRTD